MVSKNKGKSFIDTQYRYVFSLRSCLELLAILLVAVPIVVAPLIGTYQRGFVYNDHDIAFPYKEGTVGHPLLYSFSLGIPLFLVLVGEYFTIVREKHTSRLIVPHQVWIWRNGPRIPEYLVSVTRIIFLFLFGYLTVKSVCEISKHTVGRLRPHFLDVCRPNLTLIELDGGCTSFGAQVQRGQNECNQFITDAHCTMQFSPDPEDHERLNKARLSFISGHSTVAFHSMFFAILYVESRFRWMSMRYCKAVLQFGLFLLAALCGLSRISDHKHHWQDVFTGMVVGVAGAVVTVLYVGDFFDKKSATQYTLTKLIEKMNWSKDKQERFVQLLNEEDTQDSAGPYRENSISAV